MGSLVSRTATDFERFSGLHSVDAALSQQAPVEEGIARPIREFDESKALLRVEPLDGTVDRGTGGRLDRLVASQTVRLANPRAKALI